MSARTIKVLSKATAAAGLLSAAAIIASAVPASASPYVTLKGIRGSEEFTCKITTHGINVTPLISAANGCGNRVWLHKNLNGSGWGYCISGHANINIPTKYQNPQQAQVSANKAKC
jgi:hypothetical protein